MHSAILLQVPNTNSVESWHVFLKYGVNAQMLRWSLQGLVKHLANVTHQWDLKARKTEADFRSKHLTDTVFFPGLSKLPYPVQKLIIGQLKAGNELLEQGVDPKPLGDNIGCDCLFWAKYGLPCAHIWHLELHWGDVLTEDHWKTFAFMFEDCGFEIMRAWPLAILIRISMKKLGHLQSEE